MTQESRSHVSYPQRARRLKKLGGVVLIVVGAITLFCHVTITEFINGAMQRGGIYAPESKHIFKPTQSRKGVLAHKFRVYNLRPTTLILEAEADCGCTSISWNHVIVRPFGWVDLNAEMKSPGITALEKSATITLKSNRAEKKYYFLSLGTS